MQSQSKRLKPLAGDRAALPSPLGEACPAIMDHSAARGPLKAIMEETHPEGSTGGISKRLLVPKVLTIVVAIATALLTGMPAAATTLIHLHANSVTFYYDRFLLEADGDVRVTTSDGITMSGDAFSMDLKLNRFVLAGHVHVQDAAGAQEGAAVADFLDYKRIYFLPILRQAQEDNREPDRWTFLNGDFAHPAKGRVMPGDTFFFPDLGKEKPFLKTDSAVVGAGSFVRFSGNRLDLANGLGAYAPTPSFYVNFSDDQHLGDNSLAGANYDATWNFAGSANAISALHFRYDTLFKTYMSFEQHLSGKKAYAVFSINPMTRPSKFWDLVLSDQPSPTFQVRTFTQLHTFQHWLTQPDQSGQFTILNATKGLPHSFLQLNVQDTNFSLLPPLPPGQGYHGQGPVIDHPYQMLLTGQTFDHRIGHLPIYEHIGYSIGYGHDSNGMQSLQRTEYTTIWNHSFDFLAYVPSFKIGNSYVQTKNYYINASFEKSRQWFSVPHHIDTTTTRVSLSKIFDQRFTAFLSYEVQNVGDYYGALQPLEYPSFVPCVGGRGPSCTGGVSYPGYAAFRGIATFRDLALDVTYANAGNFTASILARKHDDFPQPIPNFFKPPLLDNLGHEIYGENYLGEPPYDVTADVQFRVNDHMSIDVSRAYYFHWGSRGWSPEFVVQVTQSE